MGIPKSNGFEKCPVCGIWFVFLRGHMKVKHYKEWEKKYGGTNVYDKDWFGRDAK